jgi:hypothetical protein
MDKPMERVKSQKPAVTVILRSAGRREPKSSPSELPIRIATTLIIVPVTGTPFRFLTTFAAGKYRFSEHLLFSLCGAKRLFATLATRVYD